MDDKLVYKGPGASVGQRSEICMCVFYPQSALVQVFRSSRGVFDLLAEDERQLKEEEVTVSPLPDQRLWLPNQKGVLEEELTLNLKTLL